MGDPDASATCSRSSWSGKAIARLKRALATLAGRPQPALVFLLVRALLGYGARGSGVYVDPRRRPAGFGLLLLHRVPVFIADMLFNVPASSGTGARRGASRS